MPRALLSGILLILASLLAGCPGAQAQVRTIAGNAAGAGHGASRKAPVTFTADRVRYDQQHNLVIASGHVEAWQGEQVLRADQVTFDRATGTVAARGNVVLLTADGEVIFADYAELTQNMTDGVLKNMRALLAQNGKLAANGARRTAGKINELSKVVYSPCNLCKKNPKKPPLWQIRAASAVQDLQHKRIEYQNATLQMYGLPVAWFPYISAPDPSVRRASGILMPSLGNSSTLGAYFVQPYYWVLDDQSDATIVPVVTSRSGALLDTEYRRRFNDGYLLFNGSAGYIDNSSQYFITTNGQFDINDTWRMGWNVSRASSTTYLGDFSTLSLLPGYSISPTVLSSDIYAEGFGEGAYARLDTQFYQGVSSAIADSNLPVVLPRYQYSYFGQPDALGGRLSVDAGAFNVLRTVGTNTRRANVTVNWERPFVGALGDLWKITLHGDAIGYDASHFNEQPNFGPTDNVDTARALPQLGVDFRWPFMRDSGKWGTQVIEPMLQLIVAPQTGASQNSKYPNEDSLAFEFSDANLFGFNRFSGIDRLEGGVRLNAALHGTWYLGGTTFDGLIGQSYRTTKDNLFPEYTGLHDEVSDIVARASFAPTSWLNLTYRPRLDHNDLATRMADALVSVGVPKFSVSAGYLYTTYDPYTLFDQPPPPPTDSAFYSPRDELTMNVSSNWGKYRFTGFATRNLTSDQMVVWGADAIYENECFIFDARMYRVNTALPGEPTGATVVLFQLTFKTIGQFGYRAL
jgi:LPS-assembly protein